MSAYLENPLPPVCFHAIDQPLVTSLHAEGRGAQLMAAQLQSALNELYQTLGVVLDARRIQDGPMSARLSALFAAYDKLKEAA